VNYAAFLDLIAPCPRLRLPKNLPR